MPFYASSLPEAASRAKILQQQGVLADELRRAPSPSPAFHRAA
jgi:hypothetical protein